MKKTHLAALIAIPVVIGALILSVAAAPFGDKRQESVISAAEPPAVSESAATELTREQAIQLALEDAGLSINEVRELEAERDRERGVAVYEIEFEHGKTEYEYEIRIGDGKIVEKNVEIDD